MMLRLRSFYGKIIVFILVVFCFILYLKVLQVEDTTTALENDIENGRHAAELRLNPRHQLQQRNRNNQSNNDQNDEDNEIPIGKPSTVVDWRTKNDIGDSRYEISVQLDLKKQEPGLGDNGEAVNLHGAAKEKGDKIYKKIALNEELSERLSYNRTVPDARNPLCRSKSYQIEKLPTTSVIVIFFDEPYSVLLRTIHSTLNTCHPQLLKEIILVDDGSTNMELGGKLDYYIKTRIPNGNVKVLRLNNRLGLIRARLAGARIATGDVLIFLDAHCEGVVGWCEPLLDRIRESRTSVLVPIIDVIDSKTFQYSTNGYKTFQVGGFEWSGHFDWINVSDREKKRQRRECKDTRDICPAHSPTMAGGLFAIDRRYFWEIGSYDEQMDGWGGENLEMSFRIWQCGGTIETIPCSRVGHVFRDFHPYKFPNDRDTHGINTARMALVWMDDYVNIFFLNRPDLKFHPDIGDVTHRVMLRKKLRCKSFDWYLKNIYPEKFVPTKNVIAYGRVKGISRNICLDDLLQDNEKPFNLGLFSCGRTMSKSQFFSYTNNRVLRNELACATVRTNESPSPVIMEPCIELDELNEKWNYENEHFIHVQTNLCLDYAGLKGMDDVQVRTCDPKSETQRWLIEHD